MDENGNRDFFIVTPGSPQEAAALFGRLSRLKEKGRSVSAALLDSPFVEDVPAGICESEGPRQAAPGGVEKIVEKGDDTVLAVSCTAMDGIEEVSRDDLLAVCGGGVRLSSLRAEVSAKGLFFPFDPELSAGDPTLAELVMGGAISRYEGKYGRLREYILSLSLATGSGEIVRTGTRSVKNVAGYEITGLATGAGSACGLPVSVTVRLLPEPGRISCVMIPGEYGRLAETEAGRQAEAGAASIELLHGRAMEALLGKRPAEVGVPEGDDGALMLVEFHDGKGAESGPLIGLRRELAANLAGSGFESYVAMDMRRGRGVRPSGPDGWSSFRPDREVLVYGAGAAGERFAVSGGMRMQNGMIGRRIRPSREKALKGPLAGIYSRLAGVFDPAGIFRLPGD